MFVMDTFAKGLGDDALASAIFARVKVELAALRKNEYLPIDIDLAVTMNTVFDTLPELQAVREQIHKEMPGFDISQLDKLEDYALGLSYAEARYRAANLRPDELQALTNESVNLREQLLLEARGQVHRGLVGESQLAPLKGELGYDSLARDLMALTNLLQEAWPKIQGKTPIAENDLAQASCLATQLFRVARLREQGPSCVAEAADLRLRVFTMLLRTYDDIRRAVKYVRARFGDADCIIPSLRAERAQRRIVEAEKRVVVSGVGTGVDTASSLSLNPRSPRNVPVPVPM
jgi:hypothetical protein